MPEITTDDLFAAIGRLQMELYAERRDHLDALRELEVYRRRAEDAPRAMVGGEAGADE